ncbi:CheC, inhibitor of MCP methylation [Denitrovibrio acetiphilus DSM 12809]|uniref:CheC, inhibitor of MCP methylation n=1 Tax=Denitrovibrio acetiphilus (strain DSM 12809 / NBRC 114555 / N2460) TaxID=522772 RepID=D4H1J3_DENA2|nr:chemotaxis protein CheC [Denitrovibrio acetiphilus]ADD68753.1 CheC, inhibitor of MCP methylation [Denitrovibrio acetiphilus DSM 12809]
MSDTTQFFTEDEIDALQELMNIAFGQAAAELAEIIDISVKLSFPKLETVKVCDLPCKIADDTNNMSRFNIIEQVFRGKAGGIAYLLFPAGSEKDFISMFHMDGEENVNDIVMDVEREVLSEVGNILIGACVSKIFDLLQTSVVYAPPVTMIGHSFEEQFFKGRFSDNDFAIMLKTNFCLSEKKIEGFLFLVNSHSSVEPLKQALANLFESYE